MSEPKPLAKMLYCRRCGRELAAHAIYRAEARPDGLPPAWFTFATPGLYCPEAESWT